MKHIFIRHWNYWYSVYQIGKFKNTKADEVEFHISDQADRINEFFRFDLYTLSALEDMIKDDDFIDSYEAEYPKFLENYNALKRGEIELFIGSLCYPSYHPDLNVCNNALLGGQNIFDLKSPSYKPYYAVVFVGEERPLIPNLLIEWTMKICKTFFNEDFVFQINNMPTLEETLADYNENVR